jgi:hypothetical protein
MMIDYAGALSRKRAPGHVRKFKGHQQIDVTKYLL